MLIVGLPASAACWSLVHFANGAAFCYSFLPNQESLINLCITLYRSLAKFLMRDSLNSLTSMLRWISIFFLCEGCVKVSKYRSLVWVTFIWLTRTDFPLGLCSRTSLQDVGKNGLMPYVSRILRGILPWPFNYGRVGDRHCVAELQLSMLYPWIKKMFYGDCSNAGSIAEPYGLPGYPSGF